MSKVLPKPRVSADRNLPTHSDLSPSDSIAEEETDAYDVEYHYGQFFTALAIHFLHVAGGPACIPLIWGVFGRKLGNNMGFFRLRFYMFELLCHLILLVVTLLYVFYPTRTDDFRMIVIATLTMVFLRLVIISMKYGTLTRKWWQKLQQAHVPLQDLANTLLLFAWMPIPEDVATSQLKAAFGRLPIHTIDLHFIFKGNLKPEVRAKLWDLQSKSTDSFICPIDVNPETYESAFFIARLLLEGVIHQRDKFWKWFTRIAGLGYTLCPHVLRLYLLGPSTYQFDAVEWTITPLSLFFNWYFMYAMLNFIVVGIVDFQRKRWLMSQCSALISDYDRILLLESLPKIDLSDVRSIQGWYYTRRAFLDFGRRFSNRIHVYASVILPILLIAVVFIVLQMLGIISRAYNWELVSPLFLSIAFDIVIVRMILEATALNLSFEMHSDLLQEAASRLETSQKLALEALQWTVRKLEVDQELRPVTILGFTIDKDLVNKLLALGLSGAFALLKLLFT
jgi:hypothetical protein